MAPAPVRTRTDQAPERAIRPTRPDVRTHVLVLDEDASLSDIVADALEAETYDVRFETDPDAAFDALSTQPFDVLLVDVGLGAVDGLNVARRATERSPGLVVIAMTASGTLDTAVRAMRAGAFDFVNKPFDAQGLCATIERAARFARTTREVERLRDLDVDEDEDTSGLSIIGESEAIRQTVDLARRVAMSDIGVLIEGESGTGKELVARLLHAESPRSHEPFVAVNCGAVPSELLESELFGHEKGAFTGADRARDGLLLEAGGGTLLLDEVGDMTPDMQVKLLRALQERTIRRVGGTDIRHFDARVVAATNRDLAAEVDAGRFRQDLFYRLEIVRIRVPPLRDRGMDVLVLASHFLRRAAERTGRDVRGLSSECAVRLLEYDWPGNVRELENAIERAVALTRWSELAVDDLPARVRRHEVDALEIAGVAEHEMPTLSELERQYVERVLDRCDNNKAQAARTLGIDRRTLYRKLERYQDGNDD